MGVKVFLGILTIMLATALISCSSAGVSAGGSPARGTSGFTLTVIDDPQLGAPAAAGYELSTQDTGSAVVVSIKATAAKNLKALYCELAYDAAQYSPLSAAPAEAMGAADSVLRLAIFQEPGVVSYGQVLAGLEQRSGFSGDAVLASVTFAKQPAAAVRSASTAPGDALSAPLVAWDSGTGTLSWYYHNTGDYNQSFEVGIDDLTPLGIHFNDAAAASGYAEGTVQSVVDGDNSGSITIGDLTPIGVNWKKSLAGGYNVYHSADTADYPTLTTPPFTGAVDSELLLANVAVDSAGGTAATQRLAFAYTVSTPVAGECYWVRPNDAAGGTGTDGTPSNLVTTSTGNDGIYEQNGGSNSLSGKAYWTDQDDTSGVRVYNSGTFTLSSSSITTSGGTSSMDDSSFIGLNAAVLAETGADIELANCTIDTTGTGANGLFAYGSGSTATMTGGRITCTQGGAHGIDATDGGSVTITDVDITTAGGQAAAAISTDRGGGTIHVTGGTILTSGGMSPAVYSTGDITVTGATLTATGCEGTTMDGVNSITLNNCTLTAAKQGCKFHNSMPSGSSGAGTILVNGGSITAQGGALFYVVGTNGLNIDITVQNGAALSSSTGVLVDATSGAVVGFTASGVVLAGNLVADSTSSIAASLTGSSTLAGLATNASLTLDATSSWTVTGDSVLLVFSDPGGISGTSITNVFSNGFTVTYDASLPGNSALGGLTYTLSGGGTLTPAT